MLTKGDIKRTIRNSLGLLDEAYVASKKQFKTDDGSVSTQTKQEHMSLYEHQIETFNKVSSRLDTADRKSADRTGSEYASLKRDELFNMNGIHLHELYFANIDAPGSTLHVDSLVYMRLNRDFPDFDAWQADFIACGMSAIEGWVCTCFSTYLKRYYNCVIDGNTVGVPIGSFPVIVVDMWSHSYVRDYGTDRRRYLKNTMSRLNWDVIENRFKRAEMIMDALR